MDKVHENEIGYLHCVWSVQIRLGVVDVTESGRSEQELSSNIVD